MDNVTMWPPLRADAMPAAPVFKVLAMKIENSVLCVGAGFITVPTTRDLWVLYSTHDKRPAFMS